MRLDLQKPSLVAWFSHYYLPLYFKLVRWIGRLRLIKTCEQYTKISAMFVNILHGLLHFYFIVIIFLEMYREVMFLKEESIIRENRHCYKRKRGLGHWLLYFLNNVQTQSEAITAWFSRDYFIYKTYTFEDMEFYGFHSKSKRRFYLATF